MRRSGLSSAVLKDINFQKGRMRMNSEEKLVVRTRKNKSFGSIIMEYRQRNGWTQEELDAIYYDNAAYVYFRQKEA